MGSLRPEVARKKKEKEKKQTNKQINK